MTGRVLVIDDDDGVRLTVEHVLSAKGYLVASASNGRQGVSVFKKFKPSLVITDMMMPLLNGLETITAIKKIRFDIKIIAMSGGASAGRDDLLRDAEERGADFVITKPFEIERMLSLIGRCLPPA